MHFITNLKFPLLWFARHRTKKKKKKKNDINIPSWQELSQQNRLAYSMLMVCRPSVRRRRLSVVVHTFKLEYLWSQLANLDQILCVASLGVGERLHKLLGQIGSKVLFPWQQKAPLTYDGENDVSIYSRLFLIRSFLFLHITRTCKNISDEFEFWPDRTTDYGVSCSWTSKKIPYTYNRKMVSPC